jgi:hypothetical protein
MKLTFNTKSLIVLTASLLGSLPAAAAEKSSEEKPKSYIVGGLLGSTLKPEFATKDSRSWGVFVQNRESLKEIGETRETFGEIALLDDSFVLDSSSPLLPEGTKLRSFQISLKPSLCQPVMAATNFCGSIYFTIDDVRGDKATRKTSFTGLEAGPEFRVSDRLLVNLRAARQMTDGKEDGIGFQSVYVSRVTLGVAWLRVSE